MRKTLLTKREIIFVCLMLAVLLGLFISSSMTYHEQEMSPGFIHRHFPIIERIVGKWNIYYGGRWHNAILDNGKAGMTQFVMRKFAHFSSYFLVGLFACLGLDRLFKKWCGPLFIWLGIIGLAGLDEFHQYLTGDRTPSVHDVALDSAGALLAILICIFVYWLRHRQEKSNS